MKPLKTFLSFLLVLLLMAAFAGQVLGQTTYTIQPGDTLSSISRQFGVSVQAIAAANNIVNPNIIYAGQTLIIPGGEAPGSGGQPSSPPAPAPPPNTNPPAGSDGGTYVVQRGDTLFQIAVSHGVSIASIVQANGISNPNIIYAGQVLTIPGGSGSTGSPGTGQSPPPTPLSPSVPTPQPTPLPPTPQPTPLPPPLPPPSSQNLLPNPSFEGGYYHINGIPELQVPNGWSLELDTYSPYIRPESRVLPSSQLPESERSLFIWDGDWTMKVFKGGARISFRLLTDVHLEPGTYQFTANYYPDLVSGYNGGQKIWASGGAGEVAFIKNGVGGWSTVNVGSKNTMVQTFTVPAAGTVRVGVAFRTSWDLPNNGFFIDDWSLQRVSN